MNRDDNPGPNDASVQLHAWQKLVQSIIGYIIQVKAENIISSVEEMLSGNIVKAFLLMQLFKHRLMPLEPGPDIHRCMQL